MGERDRKEPWQKAENWQQAALALGIITLVGVGCLIPWVLAAASDYGLYRRVQVAAGVAALGGAAVTFCTVNWRGFVATRQTEVAQAQLASADENNLALLLQKGAELLAGDGNRAHLAAAIATLQAVITAENPKFAQQAMELIADLIDEKFQHDNQSPLFHAAVNAIEAGARRGYVAERVVDFSETENTTSAWRIFEGVERIKYSGGKIYALERSAANRIICENVDFYGCDIGNLTRQFRNCRFVDCAIGEISLDKNGIAVFLACDFSNATHTGSAVADLSFYDCFYRRDAPPSFPLEWMEKLDVLEDPGGK